MRAGGVANLNPTDPALAPWHVHIEDLALICIKSIGSSAKLGARLFNRGLQDMTGDHSIGAQGILIAFRRTLPCTVTLPACGGVARTCRHLRVLQPSLSCILACTSYTGVSGCAHLRHTGVSGCAHLRHTECRVCRQCQSRSARVTTSNKTPTQHQLLQC